MNQLNNDRPHLLSECRQRKVLMSVCSSFGAQLVGVLGADAFATWQVGARALGKGHTLPETDMAQAIPKGDVIFQPSTFRGYMLNFGGIFLASTCQDEICGQLFLG